MNKIYLLSVVILLFSSCNQQKEGNEIVNNLLELNDAISKAKESEIIETKTFLGFKFGMTEKEVDSCMSKLLKEGKIQEISSYRDNNKYKPVYLIKPKEFEYDYGNGIYLLFIPEYEDGRLYKMTYPAIDFEGYYNSDVIKVIMREFKIVKEGFQTYMNIDSFGDTTYMNIKDNMIITFRESEMIYENAPILKLIEEKYDKINNKNIKQPSYLEF